MLYAIFASDVESSSAKRAAARSRHVEYLKALADDGRIVFAGPHPAIDSPDPGPAGYSGSLIIAEFESLEAAHAWAAGDPYVAGGVFARVDVKPVLQVLP